MIFEHINPYVNVFVHAIDRLATNLAEEVHICITIGHTLGNGYVCYYNIPTNKQGCNDNS